MLIRQGFAPVPLQLEPLVLQHDDLFDPPKSLLEQEEDLRVVSDLLDERTPPEREEDRISEYWTDQRAMGYEERLGN
jgi:hypothetical protein